jgi:hypothetical protein
MRPRVTSVLRLPYPSRDSARRQVLPAGQQGQLGAEDALDVQLLRGEGEAHRAAEVVVVGQGEGRHA